MAMASAAPCKQGEYILDTTGTYDNLLGQIYEGDDMDDVTPNGETENSPAPRLLMFVKNVSGGNIAGANALKYVATKRKKQVQPGTNGAQICGFSPAYVNGVLGGNIPNNAYFLMVIGGPTPVQSDGTSMTEGDFVEVGATAGQIKTQATAPAANTDVRGGEVQSTIAAKGTHPVSYYPVVMATPRY